MNTKLRSFVAGAVGMVVAFGIVELVHGLYPLVPSVLVAVAQRIIELTPGDFATRAVSALGKANIPILVAFTVLGTLALAGFLAYLSLRSRIFALVGVVFLAAVALAAAFTEPLIDPVATVLTLLGALGIGAGVSFFLLRTSGLLERGTVTEATGEAEEGPLQSAPQPFVGRSREAHSEGGIAVSRRNFVVVSGVAAVAGLAAGGAGGLAGVGGGGRAGGAGAARG